MLLNEYISHYYIPSYSNPKISSKEKLRMKYNNVLYIYIMYIIL